MDGPSGGVGSGRVGGAGVTTSAGATAARPKRRRIGRVRSVIEAPIVGVGRPGIVTGQVVVRGRRDRWTRPGSHSAAAGRTDGLDDRAARARRRAALEVDLVAKTLGERVRRPLAVDTRAIEPLVHGALDPAPDGLEQANATRVEAATASVCPWVTLAEQPLQGDDDDREDRHEHAGHDRPAIVRLTMPIDVVQPVAQDRRWR